MLSAIHSKLRSISALYVQKEYQNKPPSHIQQIIEYARTKNILIRYQTKEQLDAFTANRTHDGLILKVDFRDFNHIKESKKFFENLKKPQGNITVLLDKVIDPQNYGAIIRTCYYYGVDYLLVNKNSRPAITPALCQVSLGTSELSELYCVKHFSGFIQGKPFQINRFFLFRRCRKRLANHNYNYTRFDFFYK